MKFSSPTFVSSFPFKAQIVLYSDIGSDFQGSGLQLQTYESITVFLAFLLRYIVECKLIS